MENKEEKKIVKVQEYIIRLETYEDKSLTLTTKCDGFNGLELLGILERKQLDIVEQMKGIIKPDIIKRTVIDPE